MTDVIRDTIDRILTRVNAIGAGGPGFTRPSYSPLETEAHGVIEEEAGALGLGVTRDAGSNLFARLPGRDRSAPPLYIGSHLDTVPMGGAYDGVAGVAAAMALVAHFVERGETPPCDIVATVTRAEESVWFPVSYIGSRAALSRLTAEEMEARRADTGRTLADHMREEGGDPDRVLAGPGLPAATFLELHIEQGPLLDTAHEPFALIEGVRGGLRYRFAAIEGVWAHSGGAPRHLRSDAVFALADMISALDRDWAEMLEAGHDLAVTVGRVDAATDEHAFAKVPGRVGFCLDMRSIDPAVLDEMDRRLGRIVSRIEEARGVTFRLGPSSRSTPSALSKTLADRLEEAAGPLGFSPRRMVSGGGHDAAAFAAAGWTSGMVFIRNWDGSHNPDEGMDPADLADAVRCVAAAWADAQARPA
ncbi:hydantoinase/carbamoylase family amidase [Kaustia mangrovi]|uniref:Hydantoinase/carbamoylase family amidase n=1 Tax=Kaustia mangrovi TaxID=2593653 RepID=A0A7S8HCX3_9HYPH|nr:hydantoinase/carbamoylase family amidase [Kaustia mangrovi]QPC44086.1 hydantoinase/carbamoylase family amidase [Kaustia mangrovi]